MPADVEIDDLLSDEGAKGDNPLAFAITIPSRAADLPALVERANAAIGEANIAAVNREPSDPLWATEGALEGNLVVSELQDGNMTESSVRAWFNDLAGSLGNGFKVVPYKRTVDVPSFAAWDELSPSLSAYLQFVPADEDEWIWEATSDLAEALEDVARWSIFPGSAAACSRGVHSFSVPVGEAGRELRLSADLDPQFSLRSYTLTPRRARIAEFTFMAKAQLQVVDETRQPVECIADLVAGLRLVAPILNLGYVRRGHTNAPSELDSSSVSGRRPTDAEYWADSPKYVHLLSSHVVDPYVLQVLNTRHLDRIGEPDGFTVEPLNGGRFLVAAKDPNPWLANLEPEHGVLEDARRAFAPILLTADVIADGRRVRKP